MPTFKWREKEKKGFISKGKQAEGTKRRHKACAIRGYRLRGKEGLHVQETAVPETPLAPPAQGSRT